MAVLPLITADQPAQAAGATYYFSPSSVKLNVGQTATVSLFISSTTEAINAGDGTIVLPAAYTSGTSISKSGSIFTLWPEDPVISGSTIRFAGGKAAPGYQGAGGKVLSFTIRGTTEGTGIITLTGGRILANNANSTNIFGGAGNATVTVTKTVSGATISSTTHPEQTTWYKNKDATLKWTKPSGVSSYSYTLSHSGAEASKTGSGTDTTAIFTGLADGIWTLALTTIYSDGKTASSSYTIRVDATAPDAFTATVEQQGESDPRPVLRYTANDAASGIDHYEIINDNKSIGTTTDGQYQLPVQTPGQHNFIVRAFDKASNTTDATGAFTVEGFAGPILTQWPTYTSVLEPLFFKGKARFDSKIILYIDGNPIAEFLVKENMSDNAKQETDTSTLAGDEFVEWSYTYRGVLQPGQHPVYAHQQRPDGALSDRSNQVEVTVLWTSIRIGKFVLPTLFLSILLGILFIVVVTIIWYRFRFILLLIKRRVKDAEDEVNHDLEALEKQLGKDSTRARGSIELARTNIVYKLDGIFKKNAKKK
jgi:hypothetical protein